MHRLLLILMIALLPLRTWAGDVMAIQMAGSAGFAQSAAASDSAAANHDMQSGEGDCHGHTGLLASAEPENPSQYQSQCNTCGTCQICHSVVIAVSTATVMSHRPFVEAPALHAPHFTSAEAALSQKPPIS